MTVPVITLYAPVHQRSQDLYAVDTEVGVFHVWAAYYGEALEVVRQRIGPSVGIFDGTCLEHH